MVLLQFLTTPTYAATAICPLKCLGHDAGSQGIPRVLGGSLTTALQIDPFACLVRKTGPSGVYGATVRLRNAPM